MNTISLFGAFAVLSLIIVPAFSQPSLKGCACTPKDCHGKTAENCCSKSTDNCISLSCTCSGQIASYSGVEYYDPEYSSFSRSGARSPARQSSEVQLVSDVGASFSASPTAQNSIGPPDPDVVEYLPPSAKQVFQVLASQGPLTQKDIISKTDLPPRTVRYALGRLRGEEMLEERFCFSDARQSLYRLPGMDAR